MSYGVDPAEQYLQAASYVDRIFKGAKPGDLPVQQTTKLEVINFKTAKTLVVVVLHSPKPGGKATLIKSSLDWN